MNTRFILRTAAQKAAGFLILAAVCLLTCAGCRQSTDGGGDTPPPPEPQGSYVGFGNLGSGNVNIALYIETVDTLGNLAGTIGYDGQTIQLNPIYTDSAIDTLWFNYTRGSTLYRVRSLIQTNGLTLNYLEPDNITSFRVNREFDGYNMTGLWSGTMTSNQLQVSRNATMAMDQQGQLFYGSIEVSFFYLWIFTVENGVGNEDAFQLSGTANVSGDSYEAVLVGQYISVDAITGMWESPGIDQGEFTFTRSFE